MEDNDKICLCFGVTKRQIEKFIRLEKPVRHSQISECYGAGTGCGWCRPFLKKIYEHSLDAATGEKDMTMTPEDYAAQREIYRKSCDRKN